MAQILDELVLLLNIDSSGLKAGEAQASVASKKLTASLDGVAKKAGEGEKRLASAFNKTGKEAATTAKGMEDSGKKAATFFSSIRSQVLALAGVTLSLAGVKNFVTSFTGNLNELSTTSQAFGMSAKSLDGWVKSGQAFGVTANEVVGALGKISDGKAQLAAGGELTDTLRAAMQVGSLTGVNIDVMTDSTEDIQRKIAANFSNLSAEQQRFYGQQLGYSYAGQQWMASGNAQRDADRYAAKSHITQKDVDAARRFQSQWTELSQKLESTGRILFNALLPYIEDFNDWLNELADWMNAHPKEVKKAIRDVLDTVKGFITTANEAATAMGGWKDVILALIGLKLAGWLWGVYRGVAGLLELGATAGATTGAAGAGIATALTRVAPWAALITPTNNTPTTSEEMASIGLNGPNLSPGIREKLEAGWSMDSNGVLTPPSNAPAQRAQAAQKGGALPRGIRNNNPGNLNFAGQRGAVKEGGDNGRFAVFGSMGEGIAALYRQLQLYFSRGINTITSIVNKYAPAGDNNNVEAYIAALAKKMGVSADRVLNSDDTQQMLALMEGIISHENGAGFVSREQIALALPQPGAALAQQAKSPMSAPQNSTTESIHIGTLNARTDADNVKGIADDARRQIHRSNLMNGFASGVTT